MKLAIRIHRTSVTKARIETREDEGERSDAGRGGRRGAWTTMLVIVMGSTTGKRAVLELMMNPNSPSPTSVVAAAAAVSTSDDALPPRGLPGHSPSPDVPDADAPCWIMTVTRDSEEVVDRGSKKDGRGGGGEELEAWAASLLPQK
jgi:hypothetical protein